MAKRKSSDVVGADSRGRKRRAAELPFFRLLEQSVRDGDTDAVQFCLSRLESVRAKYVN